MAIMTSKQTDKKFVARKTFENGNSEAYGFDSYEDACKWLAETPEAGVMLWESGQDVKDFVQFQKDVEYYQ